MNKARQIIKTARGQAKALPPPPMDDGGRESRAAVTVTGAVRGQVAGRLILKR